MALNCSVPPRGTTESCGVKLIDRSVAAVTANVLEPEIPAAVALIVAVPCAVPVAAPELVESPVTGAVVGDEEDQSTDANCCVLPLPKVPVAVSDCCAPKPIDGEAGVIAMLTNPVNWLGVYSSAEFRLLVPLLPPA